jgi:hypothetical protein
MGIIFFTAVFSFFNHNHAIFAFAKVNRLQYLFAAVKVASRAPLEKNDVQLKCATPLKMPIAASLLG